MFNSSRSSSSSVQEQDREALLRNAESLKGELERLQLLNERLNGEGLYCLSIPELQSLKNQLLQGMHCVTHQLGKEKLYMGLMEWSDSDVDENLKSELALSARRKSLRKRARELRSSSGERQEEHDREALLQDIEHVKSEIASLRLLNMRMTGKKLNDLNYFQLMVLDQDMHIAFADVNSEECRKIRAARQCKEESISQLDMLKSGQILPVAEHGKSSMDSATYDHHGETASATWVAQKP